MTAKICIEQIQHWKADFSLAKISSKPGFMVVKDDWVGALYYGGSSMDQFLWDGPSYYHDRIHGFPVAYGFDFRIEPDGRSPPQAHSTTLPETSTATSTPSPTNPSPTST